MDSIACTYRLPYSEAPAGNASPNFAKQPLRATAPAIRADLRSHNIFQRTLLWIKGWAQSRIKAASINRALSPFIKASKPDSTQLITDDHFKKLESALALADGSKKHAAKQVAEIVRNRVRSLDLVGLKSLQT